MCISSKSCSKTKKLMDKCNKKAGCVKKRFSYTLKDIAKVKKLDVRTVSKDMRLGRFNPNSLNSTAVYIATIRQRANKGKPLYWIAKKEFNLA